MLNQVVLVGRLTRDIVINKSDNGRKVATISLAIPRSFKNVEGNYDTDFISCTVFDQIASNTCEYCSKGDIVGVKGRLQSRVEEKEDKTKNYITEVICEKVTFLTSRPKDEEDNSKVVDD